MRSKLKAVRSKLSDMYHVARLLLNVRRALRAGIVHRRRATGAIITDPVEIVEALLADFSSVTVELCPKTKVEQVR